MSFLTLKVAEGWKAVRFSLRSGIRAAFDPRITAEVIRDFDQKVDDAFKRYSCFLPDLMMTENSE